MSEQRHEWTTPDGVRHRIFEKDGEIRRDYGSDWDCEADEGEAECLRLASALSAARAEIEALKGERDEAMAMLEERIFLALKGGGNSLQLGRFNALRARIAGRALIATLSAARSVPVPETPAEADQK